MVNFQVQPHELVLMSSAQICTVYKNETRELLVKKQLSTSKVSAECKRAQIELLNGLEDAASTKKAKIAYQ